MQRETGVARRLHRYRGRRPARPHDGAGGGAPRLPLPRVRARGRQPGAQVTNRATVAAYDDPEALERFAAAVDVVTIEFENLPVEPLARLAELVPVRPAPAVLAICQDRLREKAFLDRDRGRDRALAPGIRGRDELARAQAELAGPLVLKTARFGYDGKGQIGLAPEDTGGGLDALRAACRASPRRGSTSPARSR